jgi:hypothetical protein
MTDQQKADLIAAQNAKNADIVKNNWSDPSQWTDIPFVNGIPKDLYDTYLANKDLYAQKGKPPPIWYDNTVPGVVTAIPYNDPSKAVTYADPDGTLKFTNANGTPVPNDPNAVVISNTPTIAATPVAPDQTYWQPAPVAVPIQSSPVTSTYTQSQYDADMALLAKNAPSLLTPEELAKYGGGVTPTPPALVIAPVFTQNNGLTQVVYGLGTDSPYQVDETGIHYI